jgi:hypothetical protein
MPGSLTSWSKQGTIRTARQKAKEKKKKQLVSAWPPGLWKEGTEQKSVCTATIRPRDLRNQGKPVLHLCLLAQRAGQYGAPSPSTWGLSRPTPPASTDQGPAPQQEWTLQVHSSTIPAKAPPVSTGWTAQQQMWQRLQLQFWLAHRSHCGCGMHRRSGRKELHTLRPSSIVSAWASIKKYGMSWLFLFTTLSDIMSDWLQSGCEALWNYYIASGCYALCLSWDLIGLCIVFLGRKTYCYLHNFFSLMKDNDLIQFMILVKTTKWKQTGTYKLTPHTYFLSKLFGSPISVL